LVRLRILSPAPEAPYGTLELARLAGVTPVVLRQYMEAGLLEPVHFSESGEPLFDDQSLFELRRIQRLRRDLGVNIPGVGVILELLRQIDDLQHELARLRGS
jgi:DNA-binding transcriptional MerR regulator